MKQKYWIRGLPILLLIVDQIIKAIFTKLQINNYLFELYYNNHFILGYGSGFDLFFWISIFLILILSLTTFQRNIFHNFAILIMLSGASSNLIDRIFRGSVVDYIKLNYQNTLYFNLADIYLLLGLFYYLYLIGRENEKNENKIYRHK